MVVKRHIVQSSKPVKKHDPSLSPESSDTSDIMGDSWTPTPGTAFKLLMSARLCAALWSVVSDCDETFNYWEPAHFLLYGRGFQTWEYSPAYAIRSYAYILLHVIPMRICALLLGNNTILVFYMTRCLLAMGCAVSEMLFYRGVCRVFGSNIGRLTLILLLFSAGMFASSAAFLPSSFSMYLTMVAYGAWLTGDAHVAIMAIAASAILGWPFAAALGSDFYYADCWFLASQADALRLRRKLPVSWLLGHAFGIPIAYDVLVQQKKVLFFLKWCAVSVIVFLVPMVLIDMHFYGKLVIAPLNIVLYNVISGHGPELYGVEPLSYYLINGFLNFNFAYILALGSLPFLLFCSWFLRKSPKSTVWLSLAPMYIWIVIFFTRPHKEERFLFPIYPFFALAAAMVLDITQRVLHSLMPEQTKRGHYTDSTSWLAAVFSFVFATLSFSRIIAVYQGYHSPLDIYVELHRVASDPKIHTLPADKVINVCVGKEWYRYPSSFFLPGPNWHLQFIQSEFKGLLPKPYESGADATRIIPPDMNDENREEPSRYIDISRCHYLIDRDTENWTQLEPQYSSSSNWTVVKQAPFLDVTRSHRLFRAFYIPFFSNYHCTYTAYNLLKTTRTKRSIKQLKKS